VWCSVKKAQGHPVLFCSVLDKLQAPTFHAKPKSVFSFRSDGKNLSHSGA